MTMLARPRRILMTIDAAGGVWRYAMDLAGALRLEGVETVFAGFGPQPSRRMIEEAGAIGEIHWSKAPLDWMARDETEVAEIPARLAALARAASVDLLHLNMPSQAAGLAAELPVVAVSHSCVTTWFAAVRRSPLPADWMWQKELNRRGLAAADIVVAPSRSHAAAVEETYGISAVDVVYNASRHVPSHLNKRDYCFAAARWWDEGKNAAGLDGAAALTACPIVAAGSSQGPNGERTTFDFVDHRGVLDHSDAMALMDEAGIFVSPSIYEPFGLAALEAARAGSALVLADIPTYRELWQDAALFAQPSDPEAFADAIEHLAANRRFRQRMALSAQERSRQYSIRAQCSAMLAVYGRALARQTQPTAAE